MQLDTTHIRTVLADGALVLERRRDGILLYGDMAMLAGRVRYLLYTEDLKKLLVEVIDAMAPRTLTIQEDLTATDFSGKALAELRAECLGRAA